MRNYRYFLLLTVILGTACGDVKRDNSQYLAKKIVGQWEFEYGTEDCPGSENIAFRSNGTLTRTSGDCHLDDDGFGIFDYGWYVAHKHICFAYDERQYNDNPPSKKELKKYFLARVSEGYVEERCKWKIKSVSNSEINIEINNEEVFTMRRERWL